MLPRQPGTYALILRLRKPQKIQVGKLGRFRFSAGWYAYAGSARGPGGLSARIARHRSIRKSCHWHIDYVRTSASPIAVWFARGSRKRECAWARALTELPDASLSIPGFGSSDCNCPSHLVFFSAAPSISDFAPLVDIPVDAKSLLASSPRHSS